MTFEVVYCTDLFLIITDEAGNIQEIKQAHGREWKRVSKHYKGRVERHAEKHIENTKREGMLV